MVGPSIDRFTPGEAVVSHQLKKGDGYKHHSGKMKMMSSKFNGAQQQLSSFPPNNNIYPESMIDGSFSNLELILDENH